MATNSKCPRRPRYRILAISDRVEPRIYGPNLRGLANDVDLIISCGDLPYYYLEYTITVLNRPLVYVHGNHDRPEHRSNNTVVSEPMGGTNLHLRTHCQDGLLLFGLEGSHRYNNNPAYQYSQSEMRWLLLRATPELLLQRQIYGRALDILVVHAPPLGIHDAEDQPHIGFKSYLTLMRWFRPGYLLHGHQHVYTRFEITRTRYYQTEVINVYPFQLLELEFDEPSPAKAASGD